MKKIKNNSEKKKFKKTGKKSKEIIPPMKFNPATRSFEVDFDKLKEIVQETENSELEEQIEQSEIITPEEVRNFIPSLNEKTMPVLQRTESAENLEENVASTPVIRQADAENNSMNYSVGGDYSSSANYSANNKKYEQERIAPIVLKDRRFDNEPPQRQMMSTSDERNMQGWGMKKNADVVAGEVEERHGLPFEKKRKEFWQ